VLRGPGRRLRDDPVRQDAGEQEVRRDDDPRRAQAAGALQRAGTEGSASEMNDGSTNA
jgi:hypothetical protein